MLHTESNLVKYSRCFCFLMDQIPLKTEKFGMNWLVVKDDHDVVTDPLTVLPCGHAIHVRCMKVMFRISRDLNKLFGCPTCQPDWTRPKELKKYANLKTNACICNEDIYTNKDFSAPAFIDQNVKLLKCGHGVHENCLSIFQKATEQMEICPVCEADWKKFQKIVHITKEVLVPTKFTVNGDYKKNVVIATYLLALVIFYGSYPFVTNGIKIPGIGLTLGDVSIYTISGLVAFIMHKFLEKFDN